MIEGIITLLIGALGNNNITISLLIYSYLIYTIFYNFGKFQFIKNFGDLFKMGLIFLTLFMLIAPLIIYIPAIMEYLQGNHLPTADYFRLDGLLLMAFIFSFLPWIMKSSNQKFDSIKIWFKIFLFLNIIFFSFLIIMVLLSFIPQFTILVQFRPSFFAVIIMFTLFLILDCFAIKQIPNGIDKFEKYLQEERERNKSNKNLISNMEKGKIKFSLKKEIKELWKIGWKFIVELFLIWGTVILTLSISSWKTISLGWGLLLVLGAISIKVGMEKIKE